MTEASRPNRRFQFSLRRLLIFTAIAGVLLAIIMHQVSVYRRSTNAAAAIMQLGGSVSWNPELVENLVKDQTISRITDVHFTNPKLDAQQWQTLSRLPLHFGLQIDGQTFANESLLHLVGITHLDYVVLGKTSVDEDGVIEFQRQRPDVIVMFGYPEDSDFKEFPARSE
jgi:hypothetical protein